MSCHVIVLKKMLGVTSVRDFDELRGLWVLVGMCGFLLLLWVAVKVLCLGCRGGVVLVCFN